MLSSLIRSLRTAGLLLACLAGTAAAFAQGANYPNRNITLVLPFAAGSGTDTTTRIISQHLSQALGVGIIIENKAGANGMLAATYVARAAPDGYTLFVTTNTTHSANPFLLKNLTYDPVKDFTPIARTGDLPFMLVLNPEIPAKTVGELVAYAKANPGKLSYASGSSSAIVSGATFAFARLAAHRRQRRAVLTHDGQARVVVREITPMYNRSIARKVTFTRLLNTMFPRRDVERMIRTNAPVHDIDAAHSTNYHNKTMRTIFWHAYFDAIKAPRVHVVASE